MGGNVNITQRPEIYRYKSEFRGTYNNRTEFYVISILIIFLFYLRFQLKISTYQQDNLAAFRAAFGGPSTHRISYPRETIIIKLYGDNEWRVRGLRVE